MKNSSNQSSEASMSVIDKHNTKETSNNNSFSSSSYNEKEEKQQIDKKILKNKVNNSTNSTFVHFNGNEIKKPQKKVNNACFSELYIAPNKFSICNNKEILKNCDALISNTMNHDYRNKLKHHNNKMYSNNVSLNVSKNPSENSLNVCDRHNSNRFNDDSKKEKKLLSPRTRVIYEKENKLREEIQTLVDQLGTHTVKYNEAIIDKINSKNELKQLKDNRNKLIGQKSKLENQLENERTDFENVQRQTLNSLPNIISPAKKKYDAPITKNSILRKISTINQEAIQMINRNFQKSKSIKANVFQSPKLELMTQTLPTNNENDLDMIINELELNISKLKQENQTFIEYVDDLNDATTNNEKINKNYLAQIKQLDKEIVDVNNEMIDLRKTFNKTFPELKDKYICSDVNIDSLLKTSENNINEDIVSYMTNK